MLLVEQLCSVMMEIYTHIELPLHIHIPISMSWTLLLNSAYAALPLTDEETLLLAAQKTLWCMCTNTGHLYSYAALYLGLIRKLLIILALQKN